MIHWMADLTEDIASDTATLGSVCGLVATVKDRSLLFARMRLKPEETGDISTDLARVDCEACIQKLTVYERADRAMALRDERRARKRARVVR